ncbi:hypothetical protein D9758_003615 [Tetrapyrgos nigripes]|uniref:Uncharacterized protein n=1 Tax=Tetrapyrgos nigripes TaxID=182062 RepID=A0A8H5GMD9_9AGAR|nr:hypothetical protein D9758_003615 [Tetrapyrgos nigripes]
MLAIRLNELAASHQQGLLGDDEYRLLRQDVFERYANNTVLPAEVPVVPTATSPRKKQVEFAPPRPTAITADHDFHQPKSSLVNIFRKAAGRKSSKDASIDVDSAPVISLKRSFFPRSLSRKSSSNSITSSTSLGSQRTNRSDVYSPPTSPHTVLSPLPSTWPSTLFSPTKATPTPSVTSSSKLTVSTPMLDHDIFEDGGLHTTKDIRKAIMDLEAEGKRVVEAFDQLEQSTIAKIQQRQRDQAFRTMPITHSHSDQLSSPTSPTAPTSLAVPMRMRSGSTASAHSTYSTKSKSSQATAVAVASSSTSGRARNFTVSSPSPSVNGLGSATSLHANQQQVKRKGSLASVTSSPASSLLSLPSKQKHGTLSRSTSHLPLPSLTEQDLPLLSTQSHSDTYPYPHSNSHTHSHTHTHSLSRSRSGSVSQSQSTPSPASPNLGGSGSGSLSKSSSLRRMKSAILSHSRTPSNSSSNSHPPPPPPPPHSHSYSHPHSNSNFHSLSRSHSHSRSRSRSSSVVHEQEPNANANDSDAAYESPEVLDVRRRRLEVIGRYEAQIEYMRARLKGAELHEKLLRK